jgi:hypothetical protein
MASGAWYSGAAVNATDVRKADERITTVRIRNELKNFNQFV